MIEVALAILGGLLIVLALADGFETMILPRTVRRPWRFSALWFDLSWRLVQVIEARRDHRSRQSRMAAWAALQIPILVAIWAALFVTGFALIYYGVQTPTSDGRVSLGEYAYMSGVTFFTLGFGDVTPTNAIGRSFAVLEAGIGFGFLAVVISFVPTIYGGFSRREATMLRLDSRAGSRPSGVEILRRHCDARACEELGELFREWEAFSSELLEGYLSFPVLGFYRSQHDDQSWLRSLVAVMDAAAVVQLGWEGDEPEWYPRVRYRAKAFFAMGRHLLVDYGYLLDIEPKHETRVREPEAVIATVRATGWHAPDDARAELLLQGLTDLYEPYAAGLGEHILLELPTWLPNEKRPDNWEISAWDGALHRD